MPARRSGLAGNWLLDPDHLTVDSAAATSNDAALNGGTSVTLATSSTMASGGYGTSTPGGQGDITVASGLTWSSGATLELSAYNNINIDAAILITGAGGLVLATNNQMGGANTAGSLNFLMGLGSVQFTGTPKSGQSLAINGNSYTLLYSMSDVQGINNNGSPDGTPITGYYALAKPLNAATDPTTPANWTPIDSTTAFHRNPQRPRQHDLESDDQFRRRGCWVDRDQCRNDQQSHARLGQRDKHGHRGLGGNARGREHGYDQQRFRDRHGQWRRRKWRSCRSRRLSRLQQWRHHQQFLRQCRGCRQRPLHEDSLGGLVGLNDANGQITQSYASGAITEYGDIVFNGVGGLVRTLSSGSIDQSFATGAVTNENGPAEPNLGGLVGVQNGGAITNSYATGAVTSVPSGRATYIGGLVGWQRGGSIATSYSTGLIQCDGCSQGGLVGVQESGSVNSLSFWDAQTSGQSSSAGSSNGLTTAQAQSESYLQGLGWTFSPNSTVWELASGQT